MNVKTLPVGQLETNCYIVINEETLECVVIDPGDESNTIMDYIESNKLKCRAIMLTHGHQELSLQVILITWARSTPSPDRPAARCI